MNRGELWWLEHPVAGRRPACVLTRQAAIPVLSTILVVPATRTIREIPTEVIIGPEDGMPYECVLSFDNVSAVPKSLLTEHITTLDPVRLPELCHALAIATGCD